MTRRDLTSIETYYRDLDCASNLPNTGSIETIDSTIREISPLFLKENPYQSNDSAFVKCYKTAKAIFKLSYYLFSSQTRNLIHFRPKANNIAQNIKKDINLLSQSLDHLYYEKFYIEFTQEYYEKKCEVLNQKKEKISKSSLINDYIESYSSRIGARESVYKDGKKVLINDCHTKLLEQMEQKLNQLYDNLENKERTDDLKKIEEKINTCQSQWEHYNQIVFDLNLRLCDLESLYIAPLKQLIKLPILSMEYIEMLVTSNNFS